MKELRGNGIHINEEVFKTQMKKMIEENGEAYEEILNRLPAEKENLTNIFHSMNVNSDGRILSFLTLLYYERQRGVNIRAPIRLVANVMKLNLRKRPKSLWRRLVPYIRHTIVGFLTHNIVNIFISIFVS